MNLIAKSYKLIKHRFLPFQAVIECCFSPFFLGYYLILAGIYLNVLIAGALMHNPHSIKKEENTESNEENLIIESDNKTEIMEELTIEERPGGLFSLPEFYLYIIAQAILNGGYFAGVLYVSPFSQSEYSLTPVTAASMITLMGGTELLFRFGLLILRS